MADSDNFIFPSKLRLEMLINEQNGLDLRYGHDYDFGVPKPSYGTGLRYNTSVVLTFKGNRQGVKERVFYRRLSINYLRKLKSPPVIKLSDISNTVADALPALNQHYGTALNITDIVNDRFAANFDTSYECRVSDTSLAWNGGSLPFTVDASYILLKDALPINELDGLYSPTKMPVND